VTRRVLAETHSDCFLAVEHPGRLRMLSVRSPQGHGGSGRPRETLTSGIELRRNHQHATGDVSLDLVLLDEAHSDIFAALVIDLLEDLERTDAAQNGAVIADVVLTTRLRRWQHLLASVSPGGLLPEAQRGLFGELTVLADPMFDELGADAVTAWTGPDGAQQDFQTGAVAIEVKTTTGNRPDLVHINGERQLDAPSGVELFLTSFALDSRRGGPGATLPELVEQVTSRAAQLGAGADLQQRLTRAGYLHTQAHLYTDVRHQIRRRALYRVVPGFPRLTPEDLSPGVSDLSYTIDLGTAARHQVQAVDLRTLLRRNP
jgi:hypothetical protein